jgi:hypothetical protein
MAYAADDNLRDPFGSPMKLQLLRNQYARALRAIGQDLADLFPERLEIHTAGQNFVARGRRRPRTSAWKTNEEHVIRQNLTQPSPQVQHSVFVRTYTPDEIDRLDELGRARRIDSAQRPELYSLSERLRMVGRILDEKNAELVHLCQERNTITVQYRDAQDEFHQEDYSTLTLYKLQQQYYSGRCFKPKQSSGETAQSNL